MDFLSVEYCGSTPSIKSFSSLSSSSYSAAIGTSFVDSVQKFQKFLEMVKSGRGELDRRYNSLVDMNTQFL